MSTGTSVESLECSPQNDGEECITWLNPIIYLGEILGHKLRNQMWKTFLETCTFNILKVTKVIFSI